MSGSLLAALPLVAILLAAAYRRRRGAAGHVPSWRQRVVFALAMFAVVFPAVGLGARNMSAAEITQADWLASALALMVVGAIPLAIFLAFDIPLRLVRKTNSVASAT